MRMLLTACCAAVLAIAPVALHAQTMPAPLPADCPPRQEAKRPPAHSDVEFDTPKTVVLVVTLDRCGQPVEVKVEHGSGIAALDEAAVAAAGAWHFNPDGERSRVRIPIEFQPRQKSTLPGAAQPSPDKLRAQYQAMQVARVDVRADRTIEGYLPDPQPFAQASIAETVAMLEREAQLMPDEEPDVRLYVRADGLDVTYWTLFDQGPDFAPALVRQRLVSDGGNSFLLSRGLCESRQPGGCERFEDFLRTMPRQESRPPPPPPPES